MKIFILRHGQAESFSTNDSSRRLTDKGIADTHKIITENLLHLSPIQQIYVSPFIRAQQTAAITSRLLNIQSLITTPELEPETDLKSLFSVLEKISETGILLVSHLPLVGVFANHLCGFSQNRIQFNTSSLVGIECEFPAEGMGSLFLERHINF